MSREPGYRHPFAVIGGRAECRYPVADKGYYVDPTATIHEFCRVHRGTERRTYVGVDVWLMAGVHVAHDVVIHEGVEIAPNATLLGYVTVGAHAKIGAGAEIKPHVEIGQRAVIGMGAVVTKNVPPGEVWAGNPARRLEPSRLSRQARHASTTPSQATSIAYSGPESSSPATAADAAASASSASPGTSKKPTTPAPARASLDGFTVPWAPHVAPPVDWGY